MRCLCRTRRLKRCNNTSRFGVCHVHRFQPYIAFFALSSVIAVYAGLYEDLIRPMMSRDTEMAESTSDQPRDSSTAAEWPDDPPRISGEPREVVIGGNGLLSVLIEKGRWSSPRWSMRERFALSDLVSILNGNSVRRIYEFYSEGVSAGLQEYPFTNNIVGTPIATIVDALVTDLDADNVDEIVLFVIHEIHGLHEDGLISFLVLNGEGEILQTAPLPTRVSELPISHVGNYSAYRHLGMLFDNISTSRIPVAFVNRVAVDTSTTHLIAFAWTIDSACYVCPHVSQIERYRFTESELQPVGDPEWWIYHAGDPFGDDATMVSDFLEIEEFFAEWNLPPFQEMVDSAPMDTIATSRRD